ncbi:MAG: hypothetical protein ACLUEQ_12960 [Cloacibacillus evryensis]
MKELAELLIDEAKFPNSAKPWSRGAGDHRLGLLRKSYDDQNRLPSVKKMEMKLGWKPKTGMREMLNKTIEWYAENEAR